MVSTKNTSNTKKSKTTTQKKSVKTKPTTWSWRFSLVSIGIYTLVVATLVVAAFVLTNVISTQQNKERLGRIETIYSNLNLDDSYIAQKVNTFGEKRVYSYDKTRTVSSAVEYVHGDTVSNTTADLDAKIKAAGFTFTDEQATEGAYTQYHYKSSNGEYIRLIVSSKAYNDATTNALLMDKTAAAKLFSTLDKNVGPSSIVIKVNLDDNNG